MTPGRHFSALAVLAALGFVPAAAQTPLFNDGTALGGSQVFSEGFNPIGNSARFDQVKPQPAWCFSFVDGDQRMLNNASAMTSLSTTSVASPNQISDAIRQLADSPWGLRTRSYGLAFIADTVNGSYAHEEFNSALATADIQDAHLAPGGVLIPVPPDPNPGNATTIDLRRAVVDRVATGVGSKSQGMATGFTVRLERWKLGIQTGAINPTATQISLISAPDPFQLRDTPLQTTTLAVDFGFTFDLFEGFRLGGTVNRLNAKRLWDVEEKPQGRVALQMDIGNLAKLTVESDVNQTMRMPFAIRQRTSAASLRIAASRTITFLLGAERKQLGETSVIRGGATLQLSLPGYCLAFGMQYSQDHPLKGFTAVFD